MDYSKYRKNFIDWIKSQLTGPASNQEILNGIDPIDRYQTGMLFPIVEGGKGIDPAFEVESQEDEPSLLHDDSIDTHSTETAREAAQKKYRYMPPSSVGFSFLPGEKTLNSRFNALLFNTRETKDVMKEVDSF